MDKFDAMRRFVRVAELASFTKAADSLGLPKASVSSAVNDLENQLGTRLLHRSTRQVTLTQDGQQYLVRCRQLLAELDELESQFQQDPQSIRGTLRIDMPTMFASSTVIPSLPEFLARYPNLRLELSSADRRVDVIKEGFDCVIRVGTLKDSSLIARPLVSMTVHNCVSPAYLARYGVPTRLDDLSRHRLVHYAATLGSKPEGFEYVDKEGVVHVVEMAGAVVVNNTMSYLDACLAGLGIAQIPAMGAKPFLANGSLVSVLPDLVSEPMPVHMVYSSKRNPARRVRVFMEWLQEIVSADA
jgi:DNA-binding transcriptional LysR family regulator